MEDDKYPVSKQLALNFELLIDTAIRICERYDLGTHSPTESVPLADQDRKAS